MLSKLSSKLRPFRRVHNPRQARSVIHHAWLYLHLQQCIADGEVVINLERAKKVLEEINTKEFGWNRDTFEWHKHHCRECQVIVAAAVKEVNEKHGGGRGNDV
jgi:hypothetical protein